MLMFTYQTKQAFLHITDKRTSLASVRLQGFNIFEMLLIFFKLFFVEVLKELVICALSVKNSIALNLNNSVSNSLHKLVVVRGEQNSFGITDKSVIQCGD